MKPKGRMGRIAQMAKSAGKKAMVIASIVSIGASGAQLPPAGVVPAERKPYAAIHAKQARGKNREIPSLRQRGKTKPVEVEAVPELKKPQRKISKVFYDLWDLEEKNAVSKFGKQGFFIKFPKSKLSIKGEEAFGKFSAMLTSAKTPGRKILVYKAFASYCAVLHGIDPGLAVSVMKTESHYDPKAVSNFGAVGLMQVTPDSEAYVRKLQLHKVFISKEKPAIDDPLYNIETGVALLARYIGIMESVKMGAFAYNVGPNAAKRLRLEGMRKSNFMQKLMKEYGEVFGPYLWKNGADIYLKRLGSG